MRLSHVRRLARVLVVVPILQLLLLASGAACVPASADTGAVTAPALAAGEHAHHAPVEPAAPAPANTPAPHTPGHEHTTVACPMAMACSAVGLLTTVGETHAPLTAVQADVPSEPVVPPATLRGAPEPPPPRA